MPQITSIKPQQKKKNRFNIFLEGKFAFATSDILILENNLSSGKKISQETIDKIILKDEISKLMDIATRFLSYRPRSEDEIKNYLTKKVAVRQNIKFAQAKESIEIEKVIKKLKKYKYINDNDFVKWYVSSRTRSSPRGKIALKYELRQKGIENELIEKSLDSLKDEKKIAIRSVSKKIKRWQKLSDLELKKKIYQYLGMRGFSFETIKETFAFFSKRR